MQNLIDEAKTVDTELDSCHKWDSGSSSRHLTPLDSKIDNDITEVVYRSDFIDPFVDLNWIKRYSGVGDHLKTLDGVRFAKTRGGASPDVDRRLLPFPLPLPVSSSPVKHACQLLLPAATRVRAHLLEGNKVWHSGNV